MYNRCRRRKDNLGTRDPMFKCTTTGLGEEETLFGPEIQCTTGVGGGRTIYGPEIQCTTWVEEGRTI
jgi:hypothetical protein